VVVSSCLWLFFVVVVVVVVRELRYFLCKSYQLCAVRCVVFCVPSLGSILVCVCLFALHNKPPSGLYEKLPFLLLLANVPRKL